MIEAVLEVLENGGYALVPSPLRVAGVDFGFDAALVGPSNHGNLVVVAADDGSDSTGVIKRVRSLMLVLNRSMSARPVTVVLVGPTETPTGDAVAQFAHTIRVSAQSPTQAIMRTLAPLLPLQIPEPFKPTSVDDLFADGLGALQSDAGSKALVAASRQGQAEVEQAFLRLIGSAINDDSIEGDDD